MRSFRAAAVVFAAVTVFTGGLFVRALTEREIRTGLLTYALLTGAAAVGLWRVRRWGRNVALIVAMGNIGLGTLALMAVLFSRRGSPVGPALLLVTSLVMGFALGRPSFDLEQER